MFNAWHLWGGFMLTIISASVSWLLYEAYLLDVFWHVLLTVLGLAAGTVFFAWVLQWWDDL